MKQARHRHIPFFELLLRFRDLLVCTMDTSAPNTHFAMQCLASASALSLPEASNWTTALASALSGHGELSSTAGFWQQISPYSERGDPRHQNLLAQTCTTRWLRRALRVSGRRCSPNWLACWAEFCFTGAEEMTQLELVWDGVSPRLQYRDITRTLFVVRSHGTSEAIAGSPMSLLQYMPTSSNLTRQQGPG